MSIATLHENSFSVSGTGEEKSYDPQRSLESFYFSLAPKYRLHMPYEYRDDFETVSPPDYNDQFVFFMLAFFDADVEKTEMQKIDLGFSALLAILDGDHAIWISKYSIQRIKQELQLLLGKKNIDETMEIFESLIPDTVKRIRLFASLRLMGVVDSTEGQYRTKGFGF